MPERTISIRVDEETYKEIKMRTVQKGCTLKEYLLGLIDNDLCKPISLTAVPTDKSITPETVAQAQKILDFVASIMTRDAGDE